MNEIVARVPRFFNSQDMTGGKLGENFVTTAAGGLVDPVELHQDPIVQVHEWEARLVVLDVLR